MKEAVKQYFDKCKEDKVVLSGIVRLTQFHQELDTEVVMIEVDGQPVFITREELDVKPVKASLVNYVGQNITFQITGVDETKDYVLASAKQLKEDMLDALAADLESGKVYKAKVIKILAYGAYLSIQGLSVQMLNRDFSEDYTTINDIIKEGDEIEVVFERYTPNRNLRVAAKEKYKSDSEMSFDKLQPNQVVLGVVRNVKPFGCFVCVAPNLDALCPAPANMDIREGDKVTFKITQVRPDESRVRGKILKINENA